MRIAVIYCRAVQVENKLPNKETRIDDKCEGNSMKIYHEFIFLLTFYKHYNISINIVLIISNYLIITLHKT